MVLCKATLAPAAQRSTRAPISVSRRGLLLSSAPLLLARPSFAEPAVLAPAPAFAAPFADVPMRRLKLPEGAAGRDYVLVQLKVNGTGPYDFMVDSGLTGELITPHLQQSLGLSSGKQLVSGLGAGGSVSPGQLIELKGASLCCGEFPGASPGATELALPPLTAVVTGFPQEHLDPQHDPVEGMLGMELLGMFDADLDFPAGRLRLWPPGSTAAVAAASGLVEVPAAVLNETGLLGIRVTSPNLPAGAPLQPFVGIIDCGASFSAINWAAAGLLGLPPRKDTKAYSEGPTIYAVGVDGKPMPYATKKVQLTYVGEPTRAAAATDSKEQALRFAPPPESWVPWDAADVAVGDLPVFSQLLGDGVKPFKGPAALIGLDVLSQRRVILEAGSAKSRRRRLFVGASQA